MLDEVHERGINMDLLIGLFAYHMSNSKSKIKLILSSATMDQVLKNPFKNNNIYPVDFNF